MALVFSGGTLIDTTFNLGTVNKRRTFYDAVETALSAAGWTTTVGLPLQILTINNNSQNAANDETIVVLGKTYTFKTSINNSNDGEVLVDSSGAQSYTNLVNAMNLGAGSGTKYSTATTAGDGTVTGSSLAGSSADTVTWTAASEDDAGGAVSETAGWAAWDSTTLTEASFVATTAETPDYLIGVLKFIFNGESGSQNHLVMNRDQTASTVFVDTTFQDFTDNADQRIIAHKYGFWLFRPGSTLTGATMAFNTCSIPEPMRCKKISAATNAAPIAITTNVAHTYVTGQQVKILYVAGNTAANGTHTITVTGPSAFTLDGTTGNGAMTGTLGVVANVSGGYKEIFEFHQANSAIKSGGGGTFRTTFDMTGENTGYFNGTQYATNKEWTATTKTVVQEDSVVYPWFNDAVLLDAPIIAYSADSAVTWRLAGQYYNIGILRQNTPMDTPVSDASGNSWLTLTDSLALGTYTVLVA